jgi:uncharacterized protein YhbP (UPF0306 family)
MTSKELEKIVIDFMDHFNTMVLACCQDGEPWSAPVYYARQGFDLIFFSSRKSLHSRFFLRNPRVAASICGHYERWQDIKGLQLSGNVEALTTVTSLARAANIYFKRYPFASDFFSKAGFLSDALAKETRIILYAFRSETIHYLENSAGFGVRWKLEIKDGHSVGLPVKS